MLKAVRKKAADFEDFKIEARRLDRASEISGVKRAIKMDVNEFERMVETGERPGVRLVGYVVLASMVPVCGLLAFLVIRLFG